MSGKRIAEADWKVLRKLKPIALDRFCARIIEEIGRLSSEPEMTNHERYLAIYRHIHERDKELARAFDDLRRSNADLRLMMMCSLDLLTEQEVAEFSEDTQRLLNRINKVDSSEEGASSQTDDD